MDIKDLRQDYHNTPLRRHELALDPFEQFERWFHAALTAKIPECNAMVLATASAAGKPSCRTVLMKSFDETGLVFFTNYHSRKAQQLEVMPYAAVTFYWKELERQVLIEGEVTKTPIEEAANYFASRPRGSRLSTWASHQSEVVASRHVLEEAYTYFEQKYSDQEIPLPPFWGGFRIHPCRFEFWQGGSHRLHDRFRYLLENGAWKIDRLAP